MRWVVVVALAGACVDSNSVVCGDGKVCPAATACDMTHGLCVAPEQLTACDGLEAAADCEFADLDRATVAGKCEEAVCLVPVCGNRIMDVGEVCDDGDAEAGKGCSADCKSKETCGNAILDPINSENCDDGNNVAHDGCTSTCVAETARWISQGNGAPAARAGAAMAYDANRDAVVMFGGEDGTTFIDTWQWRGEWIEVPGTTPPTPVDGTVASYFADKAQVMVTGGTRDGGSASSVLAYDGTTWHRLLDADGPAMNLQGAVYDSRRKRIVAYGGIDQAGTPVDGTWEFDGATWTKKTTATVPGPRVQPAMTYDPEHGLVLMYGGRNPTNNAYLGDTWSYDGTDWTLKASTGPLATFGASLGYLPSQHVAILFGGKASAGLYGATWAWSGISWTQRFPVNQPTARQSASTATDGRGRMMLFGGLDTSTAGIANDTWFYDGTNWVQQQLVAGQLDATASLDVDRHMLVVAPGTGVISTSTLTAGRGWRNVSSTPGAAGHVGIVYDEKHHETLAYGGTGSSVAGQIWALDPVAGTWSQKAVGAGAKPQPSRVGRLVYDTEHQRVLAIGPTQKTAKPLTDGTTSSLWAWDGSAWSVVTSAHQFPERLEPVVGYDRIRHQLVVYGGLDDAPPMGKILRDTWVFAGGDWTEVSPPTDAEVPVPQPGIPMAWNPARGRLTLLDTAMTPWEWAGDRWEQVPAINRPGTRKAYALVSSFDGSGVTLMLGGSSLDQWQLRWDGPTPPEVCARPLDVDDDKLQGCADPDCWSVCTPECSPGVTCAAGSPTCGDGVCSEAENCNMCPTDCMCTTACGDFVCSPGETSCLGDCP